MPAVSSDGRRASAGQRVALVILCQIMVGFCLAWLLRVDFGTDPCSTFHSGVSAHLPISYGTWSLLFNAVTALITYLTDRSRLGPGTIANLFILGYVIDLMNWLFDRLLPGDFFRPLALRIGICIPILAVFILFVGIYSALDVGLSPYDALPFIIAQSQSRFSFRVVRTAWDLTFLVVGMALGGDFGPASVLMAFAFGSSIAYVSQKAKIFLRL